MSTALIGLGSNLGDRAANLNSALDRLRNTRGIESVATSTFHASKPIGGPGGQPEFLNAAARVETNVSPGALLATLQAIEHELGRVRTERWGPRTIDLDLLLYDELVLDTPDLTLPHPLFAFRRFALEPAAEVAPEMTHPELNLRVGHLVSYWKSAAHYVAFTGPKSESYAQMAAAHFGARLLHGDSLNTAARFESDGPKRAIADAAQQIEKNTWPDDARLTVSDFWINNWHLNSLSQFPGELVPPRLVVSTIDDHMSKDIRVLAYSHMGLYQLGLSLNIGNTVVAREKLLAIIESSL